MTAEWEEYRHDPLGRRILVRTRGNRRGQDELLDLVDFAPDVWGRRRREIGAMIWENTYLNRIGATQRCRY
jgi:hypothetical protein